MSVGPNGADRNEFRAIIVDLSSLSLVSKQAIPLTETNIEWSAFTTFDQHAVWVA